MKKYIFIALAAIVALSSCSKESLVSNGENGKEAQVFTATMEDGIATKVTFDGTNKCALWEVNDEISIDGNTYKATSAGASSTFTGEGATETTHHAYFPASIYNGGTPTLPAVQTYVEGKFNMPMYAESSNFDLSFKNLCAVLAITVNKSNLVSTTTTSLKSIKVSSDQRMNGAFSATDAGVLSFSSTDALADTDKSVALTMTDAVNISTDKTFYIAIPAQEYSYLKIYLSADGSTYKEAMITQKADDLGSITRSTMYNITYKTNAVQLWGNGPYWATMNIGATTETEFGQYFAWGETTGHSWTGTTSSFIQFADEYCFDWKTAPFNGGNENCNETAFNNVKNTACPDGILVTEYDAATKNWGKAWKMPTGGESGQFNDLVINTDNEWVSDGVEGRRFTGNTGTPDYSDITLFFPAAGFGNKWALNEGGVTGKYWSSSLHGESPSASASILYFEKANNANYSVNSRCYGQTVRALSE